MLKPLLASPVLLALLCAPALADSTMYRIDFTLASDGPNHRDTLFVSDHTCGKMEAKSSVRTSFLRVCVEPLDAKRVRLDIERSTRDGGDEKVMKLNVIATSGTSFEFLDTKMTIKSQ